MSPARSERQRSADDVDDPRLIAELKAGNLAAFETIIRRHGRGLLNVARRLLRNEDEAREAVQDAFVSAFRSYAQFEGASRVSTWLHRIVVNSCLMRLRTRRGKHEVSIDEWLPTFLPDGHHTASFVDWSNDAYELVRQRETCALVRQCIDRLPQSYRAVLIMHDIDGMTVDEVSAVLETSRNAVHIRLHRARQALRKLLDPSFAGGSPS